MPEEVSKSEGKTEQTREIEAALKDATDREWKAWEDTIQAQVDKLMDDSKLVKISILAAAGMAALAIGASALLGRAVQQIINGMGELSNNQNFIASKMGLIQQPEQTPYGAMGDVDVKAAMGTPIAEHIANGAAMDKVVQDAKTFDLPNDAVVAEPYDGPATEASEAAKAQLAEDKASGIIDQFKSESDEVA